MFSINEIVKPKQKTVILWFSCTKEAPSFRQIAEQME